MTGPLEAIALAVVLWLGIIVSSKPRMNSPAKCHECDEMIPQEPFCRECGARRPRWFEFWSRRPLRTWVRYCLKNPLAPFGYGDVAEKREDWHEVDR